MFEKMFTPENLAKATIWVVVLFVIGWLCSMCWNLFLVPNVEGIKEIDTITAIGLRGLFGLMFGKLRVIDKND